MPDQAALQHTFGEPLTLPMTMLNYALPLIAFLLTTFGLGIDWQYAAVALGSSLIGSLFYGHVRRQKRFSWQIYQGLLSTLGGLVLGSFVVWKQGYVDWPPISLTYCVSSMVSLVLMRSVLRRFSQNADAIADGILLRKEFDVSQQATGKRAKRRTRSTQRKANQPTIEETPNGPTIATIPAGAEPDKVTLVVDEQVVADGNKETKP